MKKDRNTFFAEANMSNSSFIPTPNMMQPNMNFGNIPPYQAATASQSFYTGPSSPMNYQESTTNDYESRILKLERGLKRLETRISKLENSFKTDIEDENINISNQMYMI